MNDDLQEHQRAFLLVCKKIIAVVQIVGGSFGCVSILASGAGIGIGVLVVLAFFVLAILSGVLLVLNRKPGVELALVVQGLQVFQISTLGLLYAAICGPVLQLSFFLSNGVYVGAGWAVVMAAFLLMPANPNIASSPVGPFVTAQPAVPYTLRIGVNIVAVVAVCFLRAIRRYAIGAESVPLNEAEREEATLP